MLETVCSARDPILGTKRFIRCPASRRRILSRESQQTKLARGERRLSEEDRAMASAAMQARLTRSIQLARIAARWGSLDR
jgi:hypothetical protein